MLCVGSYCVYMTTMKSVNMLVSQMVFGVSAILHINATVSSSTE